ncbi:hypothetical protein FRC09_020736 [Ceratobasidium sp. 395]|nr:hypothetical protein FRC09_020736 [Ceratobasidium sp. 395]
MEVFNSDPALYRELTSNAHPTSPTEPGEEEIESPVDGIEDDEDNPTVEEVCALILNARSAQDTTQPLATTDELEGEGEDDEAPVSPTIPVERRDDLYDIRVLIGYLLRAAG